MGVGPIAGELPDSVVVFALADRDCLPGDGGGLATDSTGTLEAAAGGGLRACFGHDGDQEDPGEGRPASHLMRPRSLEEATAAREGGMEYLFGAPFPPFREEKAEKAPGDARGLNRRAPLGERGAPPASLAEQALAWRRWPTAHSMARAGSFQSSVRSPLRAL